MCLGAAGGQTTWHPDVEQDVLLETQLLFPSHCTDCVKRADTTAAAALLSDCKKTGDNGCRSSSDTSGIPQVAVVAVTLL